MSQKWFVNFLFVSIGKTIKTSGFKKYLHFTIKHNCTIFQGSMSVFFNSNSIFSDRTNWKIEHILINIYNALNTLPVRILQISTEHLLGYQDVFTCFVYKSFEFAFECHLFMICFFCCQRYFKQFLEKHRFSQKSGNGTYRTGWAVGLGDHTICVVITQCIRWLKLKK